MCVYLCRLERPSPNTLLLYSASHWPNAEELIKRKRECEEEYSNPLQTLLWRRFTTLTHASMVWLVQWRQSVWGSESLTDKSFPLSFLTHQLRWWWEKAQLSLCPQQPSEGTCCSHQCCYRQLNLKAKHFWIKLKRKRWFEAWMKCFGSFSAFECEINCYAKLKVG